MVAGRIHTDAGATVTTEQLDFYHREGYLHLRGVLPPDFLSLTEYILSRWVDETVAQWLGEGRIADRHQDLDFGHRLVQLWHDAGRPKYSRSPRRDLVSPEMYRILVHPVLLDVAEDLLGTPELSVHGIFNARPKLPDQIWTRTPWHQDAQYYRDAADGHVVSLWYPLQAVSERNSCLQVAPRMHRGPLYDGHRDEETGFLGLSRRTGRAWMACPWKWSAATCCASRNRPRTARCPTDPTRCAGRSTSATRPPTMPPSRAGTRASWPAARAPRQRSSPAPSGCNAGPNSRRVRTEPSVHANQAQIGLKPATGRYRSRFASPWVAMVLHHVSEA